MTQVAFVNAVLDALRDLDLLKSEDAERLTLFGEQLTRLTRLHKLRIPAAPRLNVERNGTPTPKEKE